MRKPWVGKRWSLEPVIQPFVFDYNADFVTVRTSGSDRIEATGNHPFWVVDGDMLDDRPKAEDVPADEVDFTPEGRWVEARHLRVGDVLALRSGGTTRVASLATQQKREWVYNLWVNEIHTYAVGASQILVHNNTEECAKLVQLTINGATRWKGLGAEYAAYVQKVLNLAKKRFQNRIIDSFKRLSFVR